MQTYRRGGTLSRFDLDAIPGWIASGAAQELSSRSRASARRRSGDIVHGKNDAASDGTRPRSSAQWFRNSVSQLRTFPPAMLNVANNEKSIAASRPLHNAPDP